VKVALLPSSVAGSAGSHQFLTSYLINDTVAIDCGSLGFHDDLAAQMRVRHLFLSHSHMDHIASLPVLLENIYDGNADCITAVSGPTLSASPSGRPRSCGSIL